MRKVLIGLIVLVAMLALAWGGRRVYRQWQTEQAVAKARDAIERADFDKGLIWLRRALSMNNKHVGAVRLMGDFAELLRSPAVVTWRSRLTDLEPNMVTNYFLLARAAVMTGERDVARNALERVETAHRNSAEYNKIAGALAIASGNLKLAKEQMETALKLEPASPNVAIQLAKLLIQSSDVEESSRGVRLLERLRTNQVVRSEALRQLAFGAFQRTNYVQALQLAGELVSEPSASYEDKILNLNLLSATQSPLLSRTLAIYQRDASTNVPYAFTIAKWMLGAQGGDAALAWLKSISPRITTNVPVTVVVADSYLSKSNWVALQEYVRTQNWGDLEYMRRVYASRSLREQGLTTASKAEWEIAFKQAEGSLDRIEVLSTLATGWGWSREAEVALWAIVNKYPRQRHAVSTLRDRLYSSGKSRDLLSLLELLVKREPTDLRIRNDLASVSLLLRTEEYRPHDLAKENFNRAPSDPFIVSTYAFSLYAQKRFKDCLDTFHSLSAEDLRRPAIAGYYGLALSASSGAELAAASSYLDIALRGPMLPEERELFGRARR